VRSKMNLCSSSWSSGSEYTSRMHAEHRFRGTVVHVETDVLQVHSCSGRLIVRRISVSSARIATCTRIRSSMSSSTSSSSSAPGISSHSNRRSGSQTTFVYGAISGGRPVLATRDVKGRLCAFVNVCPPQGRDGCAPPRRANAKYHVCPYHGWAYDASGKNVDIKDRKTGSYPPSFEAEDHNLVPLARVASYRGFCLREPLRRGPAAREIFLGDMRFFIDVVADQGPRVWSSSPGARCTPIAATGSCSSTTVSILSLDDDAPSYMDLQARRRGGEGHLEARQYDWAKRNSAEAGPSRSPTATPRPGSSSPSRKTPDLSALAEIRARVGEQRAEWMLKARNVHVFPNMQMRGRDPR